MTHARKSPLGRWFFRGYRGMEKITRLLSGVYTGLALGILRDHDLYAVSELKYRGAEFYWTEEYNKRGLFDWERRVVDQYFSGCERVLVMAVGGGRELLDLVRRGLTVDGYESDPGLVRYANALLRKEGLDAEVGLASWDHGPPGDQRYDGVLVGWGAYMHIRGRARRVNFLRELRARVDVGSPILLSFYTRAGRSGYFRNIARIGNLPARILRRDPVEVGDCLFPNFAHFFTREEMAAELAGGGFEMLMFETAEYGHAVGRAV